jgi:hypothetical protein
VSRLRQTAHPPLSRQAGGRGGAAQVGAGVCKQMLGSVQCVHGMVLACLVREAASPPAGGLVFLRSFSVGRCAGVPRQMSMAEGMVVRWRNPYGNIMHAWGLMCVGKLEAQAGCCAVYVW